jgi:hypothetical protein
LLQDFPAAGLSDLDVQSRDTRDTALTLACRGGFLAVAEVLVKAGADVNLGASTPFAAKPAKKDKASSSEEAEI